MDQMYISIDIRISIVNFIIALHINMFKLQQIKFQASRPLLPKKTTPRHLRISLKHVTRTTTIPSKQPNQNCLIWSEHIYLPILYAEEFDFEIYDQHLFGYNPEEMEHVYHGKLLISNRKVKQGVWQVQFNNQKIGYLTAKVTCTPSVRSEFQDDNIFIQKTQQLDSQSRDIKIKSIVGAIPQIKGNSIWIQILMGNHLVKQIYKQKCLTAEILYLEEIQFYKPLTQYFLNLKVYIGSSGKEKKLLGSGQLGFSGTAKKLHNQHIILQSSSSELSDRVGQIFIKYTSSGVPKSRIALLGNQNIKNNNQRLQEHQSNLLKSRNKSYLESEISKLYQSKINNQKQENPKHNNIGQESQKKSYHSQLLPKRNQVKKSIETTSSYSRHRYHKQISAVSPNKDVVFGKANRFPYQKPMTEFKYNISRSFDFRTDKLDETQLLSQNRNQQGTKQRYYRGASFGKGYKTDFTKLRQKSPGVGSYQLPTIWDRY